MQITHVGSTEELTRFCTPVCLPHLDPDQPSVQDADAHWYIQDGRDRVLARCSLWWRATPSLQGVPVGYVGHYAAQHRDSTDDAAARLLLQHVCRELVSHGCAQAIGPLDGNTFRAYRFVTQRAIEGTARPTFFLEPDNPAAWPEHFLTAEFTPLAHYYSAQTSLSSDASRRNHLAERNQQTQLRPVNLDDFAGEVERIYTIVRASFQDNLLYQPITQAEFAALYAPLKNYILPQLVWIAERNGEPVGFIFAMPDLAQRARGETVDTVILKTMAVVPEAAGSGLGSWLVATCQDTAHSLGFRTAIHALMHEDNISRKISRHYASLIRQYTLFARALEGE